MSRGSSEEFIEGDLLPIFRYSEIHERYATSPYGLHQANQPLRYSQEFAYDPSLMLEDLGDDIHPVRHMTYTESRIVRPMLTIQNENGDEQFDTDEIMALRLAALLHDIGECEHPEIHQATGHKVGDVSWEHKTEDDGVGETAIRQYLYSQLYEDIPTSVLAAADDIIDNKEGSLPRETFNAAERLGYYTTAIRAGEVALTLLKRSDYAEVRVVQLSRLATKVSNNHRQFLQERCERFPYLGTVLRSSDLLYESIQAELQQFTPSAPVEM